MTSDITARILDALTRIEREHEVRVLYAVESGSRAWGFPSEDSDFDVRFLYLHPRDWYLSVDLERKRDVIELPIDDALDVSGWELRKALKLFRKSNPPLLEWLGSPIVYAEPYSVAAMMRAHAALAYSPRACMYHYLHMARGNVRDYVTGETVWLKKYLYVLRPLLAVLWLERELGVVPTEFDVLVRRVVDDPSTVAAIDRLVAAKRAGQELDRGPRVPEISDFIARELARLEREEPTLPVQKSPVETLNALFRAALDEVWERSR